MNSQAMRIVLGVIAALALFILGFFVLTPAPIEAHYFDTGPAPAMEGVLAPNDALAACQILGADEIVQPEELERGRRSHSRSRVDCGRSSPGLGFAAPPSEARRVPSCEISEPSRRNNSMCRSGNPGTAFQGSDSGSMELAVPVLGRGSRSGQVG